jgi:tRNA dimethylallyltransferase
VSDKDPVIAVVGPTAAGKSDLALELALRFGGEIVGCDALQVYRHMDVGTAKTPPAARRGIPHHLIDVREPHEEFTAGDYQRLARASVRDILLRGNLPVVAGGTGFYLKALFEGLFNGP